MDNKKVIISAALTGGATSKAKNENLPVTPKEIAEDAYRVWKAGAAIVHLHMRDQNNVEAGTMDAALFKETIDLIRGYEDCDVIINCTSSGGLFSDDARLVAHSTIPDIEIGSCDIGTFNWNDQFVFYNTPEFLHKLCDVYNKNEIKPEVEIFDYGMIKNAEIYIAAGRIKEPMFCQLMLGVGGMMEASVENLLYLVRHLPKGSIWSCSGIGTGHLPMMYASIALGGNIRVGLEDNIYYDQGVKATNLMLIERAVRVVKEFNKTPATSVETREMLGIKPLTR